jgi:hypothetical protein
VPHGEEALALLHECTGLMAVYVSSDLAESADRRAMSEFFWRLRMLTGAYARVVGLVARFTKEEDTRLGPVVNRRAADAAESLQWWQLYTDIFVYTEWFYHTAWRLLEVAHLPGRPLPGLHRLRAPGIRAVRNEILMHPERHEPSRQSYSTAVSPVTGPSVGMAFLGEAPQDPYTDPGLFPNALEFAHDLRARLRRALENSAKT